MAISRGRGQPDKPACASGEVWIGEHPIPGIGNIHVSLAALIASDSIGHVRSPRHDNHVDDAPMSSQMPS